MNPLKTLGFHHITMVSTDAPRTLAFYGDLLGFDLVKKTVNFDDPGAYHLYFGRDGGRPGTILTFFEWAHARRGHWGVGGVHHLALGVATPEAQLKWKRRLTDAGVSVSGPIDRGYFQSLYFEDPDGQILEIATAGPGYAIDEPQDALGRELVTPPQERLPDGRDEAAIAARTHPEPVPEVTPDMRLDGIHHITGITDDIERASDFYQQALGLRIVKKTFNQDDAKTKHYFWARYDGSEVGPHSALTLFGWEDSRYVSRPGAGQTHHIAFRAEDAEEQAAWREHLLSLGLNVSPVMDRTYFESIYFHAPDGLLLEIATDGPGFAVDEPAHALGSALKLPSWLEERRSDIERKLAPLAGR
ncbi:MAG TPA: VOC family protein [Longimicrobiales bacterium]|nr:VOC family protein [Longimicrobiales bacterium]